MQHVGEVEQLGQLPADELTRMAEQSTSQNSNAHVWLNQLKSRLVGRSHVQNGRSDMESVPKNVGEVTEDFDSICRASDVRIIG